MRDVMAMQIMILKKANCIAPPPFKPIITHSYSEHTYKFEQGYWKKPECHINLILLSHLFGKSGTFFLFFK